MSIRFHGVELKAEGFRPLLVACHFNFLKRGVRQPHVNHSVFRPLFKLIHVRVTLKRVDAIRVTDSVLFRTLSGPVQLNTRTLVTLPAALNGRISMTVRLCCTGLAESGIMPPMKYWEMVADKLSAAGWRWGTAAPSRVTAGAGLSTPIAEMVGVILSNLTNS